MSDSEYDDDDIPPLMENNPIIQNRRGVGTDIIIIEEPYISVLAAMHLGIPSESARRNSEHLLQMCIKEEEEKLVTVIDDDP